MRLARVHAASTASDAAIAVALAGSIFFSISPDAARWRVALYLALTMAPFAVVTPLIGPAIDRMPGGRRAMIIITNLGRFFVAALMIRHVDTLWLFPEAFSLLVLQKGYGVAKAAVVPRYVDNEAGLMESNSRLALLGALMSVAGALAGGVFALIGGPSWAAVVATLGYAFSTVLTFRLPRVPVAAGRVSQQEKADLRRATILLAASAMAIMRGSVGFVTFLLAFALRGGSEGLDVSAPGAAVGGATATLRDIDITGDPRAPIWHFGVVVVAAACGSFASARYAPVLRRRYREESMLLGALVLATATSLAAALAGGLLGNVLLSAGIAIGAASGKLLFDSLVQRDAPDVNHGRSFSRFEARFQIAWVVGAFVPAVIPIAAQLGAVMVSGALGFALVSYWLGRRQGPAGVKRRAGETGPVSPRPLRDLRQ